MPTSRIALTALHVRNEVQAAVGDLDQCAVTLRVLVV
jgi:hypothetical protein